MMTHVERISQIKFKTAILKSSLCNYGDAYILLSRNISITGNGDNDVAKPADQKKRSNI